LSDADLAEGVVRKTTPVALVGTRVCAAAAR
jgi:hypothetical protein